MSIETEKKNQDFIFETFIKAKKKEQPIGSITSTNGTDLYKKFDYDIRAHVDFLQPNYHEKWIWLNFGKEWNFSPLYTHKLSRYTYDFLYECRNVRERNILYFNKFMQNVARKDRGNNYFLECNIKDLLDDESGRIYCEESVIITEEDISGFIDLIKEKEIKEFFINVKNQLDKKCFFLFFSREHNHDIHLEDEHILGRMNIIHSNYIML